MTRKHVALSAVLGKGSAPAHKHLTGKRANGCSQLCVLIPDELRRNAKAKAVQAGLDISDVVGELLTGWLANRTA